MRNSLVLGMCLLMFLMLLGSPASAANGTAGSAGTAATGKAILSAANTAGTAFELRVASLEAPLGETIEVSVIGSGLTNLYGFEVALSFDAGKLAFLQAASGIAEFAITPQASEGEIVFAATKLGNKAGESGNAVLCTFVFQAIGEGDAALRLAQVKTVNSLEQATVYTGEQISAALATVAVGIPDGAEEPGEERFPDIAGHWAEQAILQASAMGWVNGYEDGTFRPQREVKRIEFIAMVARALDLQPTEEADLGLYKDAAALPDWAVPYLKAAISNGIVQGYEDHTLRIDRAITRSEMAAIIVRALQLPPASGDKPPFVDQAQIPAWAQPAVAAAAESGLIRGRGNHVFAPLASPTRAEAVTIILAAANLAAAELT